MAEKQTVPDKTPKNIRSAANYAELVGDPKFRRVLDRAFDETGAEDDGERYADYRENTDVYLGRLAGIMTLARTSQVLPKLWELQRDVTRSLVSGESVGPFADYFMAIKVNKQKIESAPGDGDISHLPPGERGVVVTNSRIMSLSQHTDDPMELFDDGLHMIRGRKNANARQNIGPENYATLIKYVTDKTDAMPIESDDLPMLRKYADECMSGFCEVAKRDAPNVVEMTNILSAIKRLPAGTFDEKYTANILRYTLETLPEFTQEGLNLVLAALPNLDITNTAEAAGYTVDLVLRNGAKFERSGNLRTALRAVAHLPKTVASERAFNTLLDVRNNLEVSANIDGLDEINDKLRYIVENVTENPDDTQRAKKVAELVATHARNWLSHAMAEGGLTEKAMAEHKAAVARIQKNARAI
jgi:hypothetical protein